MDNMRRNETRDGRDRPDGRDRDEDEERPTDREGQMRRAPMFCSELVCGPEETEDCQEFKFGDGRPQRALCIPFGKYWAQCFTFALQIKICWQCVLCISCSLFPCLHSLSLTNLPDLFMCVVS